MQFPKSEFQSVLIHFTAKLSLTICILVQQATMPTSALTIRQLHNLCLNHLCGSFFLSNSRNLSKTPALGENEMRDILNMRWGEEKRFVHRHFEHQPCTNHCIKSWMELEVKKFTPQSTLQDRLETTNNHTIHVQSKYMLNCVSFKNILKSFPPSTLSVTLFGNWIFAHAVKVRWSH